MVQYGPSRVNNSQKQVQFLPLEIQVIPYKGAAAHRHTERWVASSFHPCQLLRSLHSRWFVDDYNFCSAYHCYWQANPINRMAWLIKKEGKLDRGSLVSHFFFCQLQPPWTLTIVYRKARSDTGLSSLHSPGASTHMFQKDFPNSNVLCFKRKNAIQRGVAYILVHRKKMICLECPTDPPVCQGRKLTAATGPDSSTFITRTVTTPFQFCSSLSL